MKKQNIPPLIESKPDGKIKYSFHPGQVRAWNSFKRFVFVLSGTQSGKCVHENALVTLKTGECKRIKDITAGTDVLSLTDDYKVVPSKVLHLIDSGTLPTYRVKTATNKYVDVSETHPFLTKDGWKEIKLIDVGEAVGVYERINEDVIGGMVWDEVTSIEYIGEEQCYDLEIENYHNFVANNIFVHNTSWSSTWLHREMQRAYLDDHGEEVVGIDPQSGRFLKNADEVYNLAPHMVGSGDFLSVTASFDLFKLKFLPVMRELFEEVLHIGKYWASARVMEIKDPSTGKFLAKTASDPMYARIILRSADSKRGLESSTARAALLDECGMDDFRLEAWEAVLRRLSLSQGRVCATTTLYNFGWMKTEVHDRWAKGDPDIDVIQFNSVENPAFPLAEYERARRTMPAWKFDLQYRGIYSRPAGMIFSDYDSAIHKIRPFPIPSDWQRHVGIDPGAVHTGMVWIAEDRAKGIFYAYRSTLDGNKTTAQHVAQALEYDETVTNWVGGAKSEEQFRMDWTDAGIRVQKPPISEVEAGIDRVISLFKTNRLFIFDTCGILLDELGTYSRVLDTQGQPTDTIKDKNKFHLIDSTRYICAKISKPPTTPATLSSSRSGAKTIPGFGASRTVPSMGVSLNSGRLPPCM